LNFKLLFQSEISSFFNLRLSQNSPLLKIIIAPPGSTGSPRRLKGVLIFSDFHPPLARWGKEGDENHKMNVLIQPFEIISGFQPECPMKTTC